MSVRSPINVYRIRDTETDREKIVHRNLLLPVNFLYKDEVNLPSHSTDLTSDLPDHPDNNTRTAHWVMQSDQPNCSENDSNSIDLSGVQCSLDVQNYNSKADSDTCNSSVSTEQQSDLPHVLDEELVPDEELGQSSSQHSSTMPVFTPSQVDNNPVPDTVDPVICTQPENIPTDTCVHVELVPRVCWASRHSENSGKYHFVYNRKQEHSRWRSPFRSTIPYRQQDQENGRKLQHPLTPTSAPGKQATRSIHSATCLHFRTRW
ncbi:hypothetical protein QQF64_019587 [Cirrhinus molitorella]|uniref:WW domain-containing protein n=1 Tax=Cirrhinus molitorella TaxID=172907 RepID=A0ABR3LI80_9TELE